VLAAAVLLFAALVVPPAPTAHVNDYAHVLSSAESQAIERTLTEREAATGAQMVVAIFPSLEGESLEDFSIRLAQQWRIGQKKLDNGVILLVFVNDRKVRIEVGYGLEPVITDAVSAQIIRERIAPRFREGRYAAGIDAAVAAVFERIGPGGGTAAKRNAGRGSSVPIVGFVAVLAVIAFILLREISSRRGGPPGNAYTAGRQGWETPVIMSAPWWIGRGRGGGGFGGGGFGGGGGGFSGGGGGFGGGGASGDW
jgi:uncharacterized protein